HGDCGTEAPRPRNSSEPRDLRGRRGGTDEFLGRGASVPQSPWSEGQGGRPSEKGLVQQHADTVIRKSHAAVSAAVNSSPVRTPRKKNYSSPVRRAPDDRRGHIRVRPRYHLRGWARRSPGAHFPLMSKL